MTSLRLLRAHLHARIVRFRLGSDTPAYAAALADLARLRALSRSDART